MSWLTSSPLPIMAATGLYLLQAAAYWQAGQKGMALTFVGYSMANVGLILAWYEMR